MGAPIDPRVETIKLLRSIDASLKTLVQQTAETPEHEIASDADLDSQYGDPTVKAKDPRDWAGAPMMGRRFSECPPEYLDLLADRFDYFASKEEDPKKAGYNRKDAARARGWARRIRNGKVPIGAAAGDIPDGPEWPEDGF